MYKQRKATKRFTLLLLEEEEDYVHDWVATCKCVPATTRVPAATRASAPRRRALTPRGDLRPHPLRAGGLPGSRGAGPAQER